jgi:hypothetical protein
VFVLFKHLSLKLLLWISLIELSGLHHSLIGGVAGKAGDPVMVLLHVTGILIHLVPLHGNITNLDLVEDLLLHLQCLLQLLLHQPLQQHLLLQPNLLLKFIRELIPLKVLLRTIRDITINEYGRRRD